MLFGKILHRQREEQRGELGELALVRRKEEL